MSKLGRQGHGCRKQVVRGAPFAPLASMVRSGLSPLPVDATASSGSASVTLVPVHVCRAVVAACLVAECSMLNDLVDDIGLPAVIAATALHTGLSVPGTKAITEVDGVAPATELLSRVTSLRFDSPSSMLLVIGWSCPTKTVLSSINTALATAGANTMKLLPGLVQVRRCGLAGCVGVWSSLTSSVWQLVTVATKETQAQGRGPCNSGVLTEWCRLCDHTLHMFVQPTRPTGSGSLPAVPTPLECGSPPRLPFRCNERRWNTGVHRLSAYMTSGARREPLSTQLRAAADVARCVLQVGVSLCGSVGAWLPRAAATGRALWAHCPADVARVLGDWVGVQNPICVLGPCCTEPLTCRDWLQVGEALPWLVLSPFFSPFTRDAACALIECVRQAVGCWCAVTSRRFLVPRYVCGLMCVSRPVPGLRCRLACLLVVTLPQISPLCPRPCVTHCAEMGPLQRLCKDMSPP